MMTPEKESDRGLRASQLLDNEIFREAFDNLQQGIIDKWIACPIRDREGAHEWKLMQKLLSDLEGYIIQIAETGKMADIQLEQERKLAELNRKGIR